MSDCRCEAVVATLGFAALAARGYPALRVTLTTLRQFQLNPIRQNEENQPCPIE
jgi:hypothetical protein